MSHEIEHRPLVWTEAVESVPADEAADIQQVLAAMRKVLEHGYQQSGQLRRDVHVKSHGCALGTLQVLPNLPAELAQGIFSREQTFEAVVRFSNAASQPQPDYVPDGRGLALKVLGVNGESLLPEGNNLATGGTATQDFVMVNHPVFIARNVKDFLRIEQTLADTADNKLETLKGALTGGDWNPLNWHWREALTAAQIVGKLPAHPASLTYFSMAPIRYGDYIAKYRARSAGEVAGTILALMNQLGQQADAFRVMLKETLRSQHILFEFQVQLCTSAERMPIEDATIEWPESESPYRTVALLLLPRQEIATAEQRVTCDQLSFNVWHAIRAHQPLGGINRLRREAYPLSAAWRKGEMKSPNAD
ncbi:Catalase [Anatilimnocola aggregata]|uniref:Catalase n=1 Tax=Anatilimnocola aggregata TaxID=2528021 RepID=A0A517YGI1_9BACT|nr:catalase family protein [Anatilimnocola aggregata]QDU29336.1 Catalase [Anatilimnocola aggregata]